MVMEPGKSSRPPPSYSQAVVHNPPVPRTVSGSDTDVSTSTENLTHEEKYVLHHTERQEPQGEENLLVNPSPVGLDFSAPPAAMEWAKSVEKVFKRPTLPPPGRPPPKYQFPGDPAAVLVSSPSLVAAPVVAVSGSTAAHYPRLGLMLHTDSANAKVKQNGVLMGGSVGGSLSDKSNSSSSSQLTTGGGCTVADLNDAPHRLMVAPSVVSVSPSQLSAPSSQLSAPQSQLSAPPSQLPVPPSPLCRPPCVQQPELPPRGVSAAHDRVVAPERLLYQQQQLVPAVTAPARQLQLPPPAREPPDYVAANANEMMQILMQENSTLKQEIEIYHRKVQKLQQFAMELSKLQAAYDDLVKTCQRREQLEFMARQKLTAEVRRASELNNSLSSQLDTSTRVTGGSVVGDDRTGGGSCQDVTERHQQLVAQLVAQNRELQAAKERQDIELTAQRATLQEQRQYIDILDTALSKAQENVVRVEKEHAERIQTQYVERSTYVERVAQLQRALTSFQLASDRRETAHKKIRADMEKELSELRTARSGQLQQHQQQQGGSQDARETEMASVRQQLRVANERILLLETELAHAQQRCVDSGAESEAALLLNASIANSCLSSSSTSTVRPPTLTDHSHHLQQLQQVEYGVHLQLQPPTSAPTAAHQLSGMSLARQQAAQSIEHRMMTLEAQLVEKEAMVRALQKQAALDGSLLSPPHTRQSSLHSLPSTPATSYSLSQHSLYGVHPSVATSSASLNTRLHAASVSSAGVPQPSVVTNGPHTTFQQPQRHPAATAAAPVPALNQDLARLTCTSSSSSAASPAAQQQPANSILLALQKDREVFPDHYWQV